MSPSVLSHRLSKISSITKPIQFKCYNPVDGLMACWNTGVMGMRRGKKRFYRAFITITPVRHFSNAPIRAKSQSLFYIQISILKKRKNRKKRVMAKTHFSIFSLKSFCNRLPNIPPTKPPIIMEMAIHRSGRYPLMR